MPDTHPFIRKVLAADAVTCLAAGALMAAASNPLAEMTGLPPALIFAAGLSLFPVAALFGWMSRSRALNRPLLTLAAVGNAAWVAASLAVALMFQPTLFGYAFVLGQAAVVAGLAALEFRAARSFQTTAAFA